MIRAGNLSSWFKNSVDQWPINRTMIIYSIDCHSVSITVLILEWTWLTVRDWFLHCTLMQLYWMICRWINVISNYWGCIGMYLSVWQPWQLRIRTSTRTVTILAIDVNPCRSQTMCNVCLSASIYILYGIKLKKNKNTQCILFFYFVVHTHGYVLVTTCITIQPLCNNLAACCYWKL